MKKLLHLFSALLMVAPLVSVNINLWKNNENLKYHSNTSYKKTLFKTIKGSQDVFNLLYKGFLLKETQVIQILKNKNISNDQKIMVDQLLNWDLYKKLLSETYLLELEKNYRNMIENLLLIKIIDLSKNKLEYLILNKLKIVENELFFYKILCYEFLWKKKIESYNKYEITQHANNHPMQQTKHCYLYTKTKEQGNFPNIYHDEFGRIIYLTRKNENSKIAISGWEGNISKKVTDSFETHCEYSLNNCNSLFAYIRKNEDSITNYIYNARQYSILGWTMKIGSIFRLLWSTIFGRNISKYFLYIKAYLFFNYNQNNYTRINKEQIFITPNDLTSASNNYTNGITVRFVWRPFKKNFIGLYSQKTGREIKYVYEKELEAARWNYRIVAERKVGIDCYPKTSPCTIYKTVADDFFETIDD